MPIVLGSDVEDAIEAVRLVFRPVEILVDHVGDEPYFERVSYDANSDTHRLRERVTF